jgi:hypothetical protein
MRGETIRAERAAEERELVDEPVECARAPA